MSIVNSQIPPAQGTVERWFRSRVLRVVVVVLLLLTGLWFLPSVIGRQWVYGPLLQRIEAGDFRLSIDSVRLRWFYPLEMGGIEISEQGDNTPLLKITKLRTDRGLFGYLTGGRRIGKIELIDPMVDVDLANQTNVERLINAVIDKVPKKEKQEPQSRKPALDLELAIRGLSGTVRRPEQAEPLVVVPPLNLELAYRGVEGQPRIVSKPAVILDRVELTPELMKLGLGYAIPLLSESAWFRGRVSISTGEIEILLDSIRSSTGESAITLHEVRSGPSNPKILTILDMLAKIRNRPPAHELVFIEDSTIEVSIRQGLVHHAGLKVGLPQVDSRLQISTSGSVRLADQALELSMLIPVPVEFLARRESVKELGVPVMKLPITGTLREPVIHWSALRGESVDLLGVMRQRVQEESPGTATVLSGLEGLADGQADDAISAALSLVQKLRKKRTESSGQKSNYKSTTESPIPSGQDEPPEQKSRPVRDALKNLFKKKQ